MRLLRGVIRLCLPLLAMVSGSTVDVRCIMYLTGQHVVVPRQELASQITHVILAFMRSDVFNSDETPKEFPLFTSVDQARTQFAPGTTVSVAIGGWGDSQGFEEAARDKASQRRWAQQVRTMLDVTGADGIDIDWEYPGGNRDDYKLIPNPEREWEIEAFVQLLEELRSAIGPDKVLSIAVPSMERDLMAFSTSTIPRIVKQVDFINVMAYDMMNRRDTRVKHHSGVQESNEAMQRYIDRGAPAGMLNMGLGYYVKWFRTTDCDPKNPLGCPTQLLEDPETGADLGRTGGFSWHDEIPEDVVESFARARSEGMYFGDGSYGYLDAGESRWWSFDTPQSIQRKFPAVIEPLKLGGVFAWGLGEDAPGFEHLQATLDGVDAMKRRRSDVRDEL